jgi:hypothetical protein
MPIIEIRRRSGSSIKPERTYGVIADIPDQDGVYEMSTGDAVTIEMNPPEAKEGFIIIALISDYFLGNRRGTGEYGSNRRVVYINKKDGAGVKSLSFFEDLVVTLHTPPSEKIK